MKAFVFSLLMILSSTACTTLKPVEVPADELQRQLRTGQLVKPGDQVRLVTDDETVHKFRVSGIDLDQDVILGPDKRVAMGEVVAVETRELSVGRTALLTGGVGIGVAYLIAIAVAPAIILGGG